MQYKLPLITMLLTITLISDAYANIPLFSPMGALVFWPVVVAGAFAMIVEVVVVLFLLRKKSLILVGLAIILLFANFASLIFFHVLMPSLFEHPPDKLIFLSEALDVLFEAFILTNATRLPIFRRPEGSPLTFKDALVPVVIGNIVSAVVGLSLVLFLGTPYPS